MLPEAIVHGSARRWAATDWRAVAAAARPDFSAGFDHGSALAALRCPVLVLEADRDLVGLLPPASMAALLAVPGAAHVLAEGALHDIHSSAPQRWLDEVLQFANRIGEASNK